MDRPVNTKSCRSAVYSTHGMCATSQPLATLAGIEVLRNGGSAADAAICMLNCLNVVEPFASGVGGDMFGLYYDASNEELVGLNSSGPAPAGLDIGLVQSAGHKCMPIYGSLTITVPGALAGLSAFHERYGKVGWADLFCRAIEYAEGGFPVTEIISYEWKGAETLLKQNKDTDKIYRPNNTTPPPGHVFVNKPLARTLSKVAEKGTGSFYSGELAEIICRAMAHQGSPLRVQDMRSYTPEWVRPVSVSYKDHDVFELPPNCQGVTVLEMLQILKEFELETMGLNTSDYIHTLVEAKKFAFLDRDTKLGDPRFVGNGWNALLSQQTVSAFKNQFDPKRASQLINQNRPPGGTVYVVAVDKNRNIASFISSIFEVFGSGIVAGNTGILMQNRGSLFSLDQSNPNFLEPRKRPLHTIIPAMVFKDGKPRFAFGVMGGHMQPQGHVQILNNILVFGLGVQEACDVPRFFHDGAAICLESSVPYETRRGLLERGHAIADQIGVFGGFQGIFLQESGVLCGGSESRKDGCALGY